MVQLKIEKVLLRLADGKVTEQIIRLLQTSYTGQEMFSACVVPISRVLILCTAYTYNYCFNSVGAFPRNMWNFFVILDLACKIVKLFAGIQKLVVTALLLLNIAALGPSCN